MIQMKKMTIMGMTSFGRLTMVKVLATTAGIQSDWSVQNITGQVGQRGLDSQRVLAGSREGNVMQYLKPRIVRRVSHFQSRQCAFQFFQLVSAFSHVE